MEHAVTAAFDTRADAEAVPALRALPPPADSSEGVGRAGAPARPAPGDWPHHLPRPLTSFIGRAREIAEARRLLGETRLLTLVGTGGVGKTRLGQEIAVQLLDTFEDGVWVVELAALTDAALVPHTVASVLGLCETPDQPVLNSLLDRLRSEYALLVLDNCEHLIDACAEIADSLLRACPGLRILATSREALGIAGETVFPVPSLTLPRLQVGPLSLNPREDEALVLFSMAPGAAALVGDRAPMSDAVHLFVERARAALPSFVLTDRNIHVVEQICQRLDGIPLAIELAAARVAVLSLDQIALRLGDRFRFLSGGSRTALPRYRTLRALVDWSHDLLDERERTLMRRLAVFSGGWTLEAAEGVCAGAGLDPDEVFELLSGLVAKSLVLTGQDGDEVRYGYLETLREYAAEKLSDAGEASLLREQHCTWFVAFAERAESQFRGPQAGQWLDRLDRERENVRSALTWCIQQGAAEYGLRLVGALGRFWLVRGPYREVRATLADLLTAPETHDRARPVQVARARALYAAGMLAMRQDDRTAATAHYQEALAIGQQLGDRKGEGIALFSIGHIARVRGEYSAARSGIGAARQVFQDLGDTVWLALTHHELGVAAFFEGDLRTAREQYEASLTLYQELGDEVGIVAAFNDLGEVALLEGDLRNARVLLRLSLELARRIDDKERIAMVLAALGGLAGVERQPVRALRLVSAALGLNEATGQRNSPAWRALVAGWEESARQSVSQEVCAEACAAGRAMAVDAAIAYALSTEVEEMRVVMSVRSAPVAPAAKTQAVTLAVGFSDDVARSPDCLTQREREVAGLVARGMRNRQLARELVIAEGTAANHVKHILAKLVLDSRVQVAAWAIAHGLHEQAR